MFALLPESNAATVNVTIDGTAVSVPAGTTVAAAMLLHSAEATRTTPVSGEPRAPYCLMGVCFECLVEIDGEPNVQGCMVIVKEGMRIVRPQGRREAQA